MWIFCEKLVNKSLTPYFKVHLPLFLPAVFYEGVSYVIKSQ